jgi:hypothetical protein
MKAPGASLAMLVLQVLDGIIRARPRSWTAAHWRFYVDAVIPVKILNDLSLKSLHLKNLRRKCEDRERQTTV